jgi:CRISPR-associated protein Cas2
MSSFVVLQVENVPDHLRGYLERFLQEVRTGLYVGTMTARVADHLWEVTDRHAGPGDALIIRPDNNEAGYAIRARDHEHWRLIDHEGWMLSATRIDTADPSAYSPYFR